VRWTDLVGEELLDAFGDVVVPACTGSGSHQPPATAWRIEERLDRNAGELGDRDAPSAGFVAEASVKVVRELDRGALHVCQHTIDDRTTSERRATHLRCGRRPFRIETAACALSEGITA
jgi:hypothetical protein